MERTAEGFAKALIEFRATAQSLWRAVERVNVDDGSKDFATHALEGRAVDELREKLIDLAEDAETVATELGLRFEHDILLFPGTEDYGATFASGNIFRMAYDEDQNQRLAVQSYTLTFLSEAIAKAKRWQPADGGARGTAQAPQRGTKVVIGHGRSPAWMELRDLLRDTLNLQVVEFNSDPVAGHTHKERLLQMQAVAGMAFLVMTAEDQQPDGEKRPRQNVVHESGYFQGTLGFERAIILLEEGCSLFSNADGINYIGFPKGHIRATFEEVRRVLKREGLLK